MTLEISTANTCKRYECWISCDLLFLITWNVVHLPLVFAIRGGGTDICTPLHSAEDCLINKVKSQC